jgi:hypothetical protein
MLEAGGLSQRKIAVAMGISRSSVSNIRLGLCRPRPVQFDEADPPSEEPAAWCRECGAMVTQPCVACRARAARKKEPRLTPCSRTGNDPTADLTADLTPELTPEQQERFDRVRRLHDETWPPRDEENEE